MNNRLFPKLPAWLPKQAASKNKSSKEQAQKIIQNLTETSNKFMMRASLKASSIPAGYTYLGQFLAHELSFDPTHFSDHKRPNHQVLRTPLIDLDSIYGKGPVGSPTFYDQHTNGGRTSFLIALRDNYYFDFPRMETNNNIPIIADPRNDEHLMLAQMHLALLLFHNKVIAQLIEQEGLTPSKDLNPALIKKMDALFEQAQRQVVLHFQSIVVYDFLKKMCCNEVFDELLEKTVKGELANAQSESMLQLPVEFSVAAFRFGHSMIRREYRVHLLSEHGSASLFGLKLEHAPMGRFFDWRLFFPPIGEEFVEGKLANFARPIFPFVTDFMVQRIPTLQASKSIVHRNLMRGLEYGLPAGQAIAQKLNYTLVDSKFFQENSPDIYQVLQKTWNSSTDYTFEDFCNHSPLWFYILMEACCQEKGERLGQVGSYIIASTIFTILANDKNSIFNWKDENGKHWKAHFGAKASQNEEPMPYTMIDLLKYTDIYEKGAVRIKPL